MAAKEPDTPACYLADEETTAVIAKIWSLVVSGPSAQDLILSLEIIKRNLKPSP